MAGVADCFGSEDNPYLSLLKVPLPRLPLGSLQVIEILFEQGARVHELMYTFFWSIA